MRTLDFRTGKIEVSVQTSRPGGVQVDILEASDGAPVVSASGPSLDGKAVLQMQIPNVKLWDCDTPNLYICRASFGEDAVEETFGVRALAWGGSGLTINGKRVILRGPVSTTTTAC